MTAPPAGWPRAATALLLAVVLAAAGCGDRDSELAPVSGVVTYRGKPVPGAVVHFYREGTSRVASGQTDEQGRFKLTTGPDVGGAAVGPNKAAVTMPIAPPKSPAAAGDDRRKAADANKQAMRAAVAAQKTPFPDRYTRPDSSGLRFDVQAGQENHFELSLKD